eukprot:1154305-Pelagomonas_calceolata.AAC.10
MSKEEFQGKQMEENRVTGIHKQRDKSTLNNVVEYQKAGALSVTEGQGVDGNTVLNSGTGTVMKNKFPPVPHPE